MTKLTEDEREWYYDAIEKFEGKVVSIDKTNATITYDSEIKSDESHVKSADPEELAHAISIGLLAGADYRYPLAAIGHEIHFAHGSRGSKSDEIDILINDADHLPYAIFELKAAKDYDRDKEDAIKNQLFGTAPLVGSPKLLVYATVEPKGSSPKLKVVCIDYVKYKSYSAWKDEGEPHACAFPADYLDLEYEPFVSEGSNDLDLNSTQADFRAIALSFHNAFFGEHADNTIFVNLVKCLLAKIHDERTCKKGDAYDFQVFYKNGKSDSAEDVFLRVNNLYKGAYKRYIDPTAIEIDELNPKEFSEERVKAVVQALQGISITKGAARHGDVIGAFFEEILRSGFKQDRGMYFTHDNLVRFMIEAADLGGLTRQIWLKANHPDNRLPYVMDPACGSGTFLLHSMNLVTSTVRGAVEQLVTDHDAGQFYKARLSDQQPNYWAENFIYGFDPKFIMAITAKVNMVLHGDGSAHITKSDAFLPFSHYTDVRLRPCGEGQRSIARASYAPDLCESFDLVVSNPPFGITISPEAKAKIATTFTLPESAPSEALFIERSFQLLKTRGRLAIVLPESVLNAKEMVATRLFLYRFFHIRAIVSLPRNIFIDTPTLTSLLFAQKKTSDEIIAWDTAWSAHLSEVEMKTKAAAKVLRRSFASEHSASQIEEAFLTALDPVIKRTDWISKGGKSPSLLLMSIPNKVSNIEAAKHYSDIIKTAGFKSLCDSYVFKKTAQDLNYEFSVFQVDEVGYKLSKRKEKARVNQLCLFESQHSGSIVTNLHLADGECEVLLNLDQPQTVLDRIRQIVKWEVA